MAPKRKAHDSDIPCRSDEDNTKGITCGCCCTCNYSHLEKIIRQVVREEIAAAPHQSLRLTPNLCGGIIPETKQFQLQFNSELKREYFTESEILDKRDAPIQIVLCVVGSRAPVTEGPMSSLEIEICVLPGDFGSGYGHQNWSREEFKTNIIVRPREGRKALLKCDTSRVTLKDGVASIPTIKFTDISRWASGSGKFILGARSEEANVREAISQPFIVKDKRGKPIMKHVQPSLNSEIWRLRRIGKKTHKQLSDGGIETVKDFLRLHRMNPSSLREKFDKISDKKWEEIVENATACLIGDNEKPSVEAAKKEAYENEKDFVQRKVDVEELLQTPQVGQFRNGNPPQQVDLLAAAQQVSAGQELKSGMLLGDEPSMPSEVQLQDFLQVGQSRNGNPPQQVDSLAAAQPLSAGQELKLGMPPGNEPSMPSEVQLRDFIQVGHSINGNPPQQVDSLLAAQPVSAGQGLKLGMPPGDEPSMPLRDEPSMPPGNEPSMPSEVQLRDFIQVGHSINGNPPQQVDSLAAAQPGQGLKLGMPPGDEPSMPLRDEPSMPPGDEPITLFDDQWHDFLQWQDFLPELNLGTLPVDESSMLPDDEPSMPSEVQLRDFLPVGHSRNGNPPQQVDSLAAAQPGNNNSI